MTDTTYYYSIVTFGRPTMGRAKGYYRNLNNARRDARTLRGGSLTLVRLVRCASRQEAIDADISNHHEVVETV